MRGIVVSDHGWDERTDLLVPEPAPDEVIVEVRAAALNHADLDELTGEYRSDQRRADRPPVAGSDLAGVVTRVGRTVTGVRPGDRVMAMTEGAFAEYVAVDHRVVVPVPGELDWAEAAALPSACMTEYDALIDQGGLVAGQSVLITAGSSGVGLVAIDIARWAGAEPVLATTTSAAKQDLLADRGALSVNTASDDLVAQVLRATGGTGADLVIDHVGGDLLDDLVAATRIGATIIQVGRLAGRRAALDLDRLAYRRVHLVGTTFRTRGIAHRAAIATGLRTRLLPAIASRRIRAHVHRVFSFDQARTALDLLRSGRPAGKVVLSCDRAAIVHNGTEFR